MSSSCLSSSGMKILSTLLITQLLSGPGSWLVLLSRKVDPKFQEIFIWLASFLFQRFQTFPEFSNLYSFLYSAVPWLAQTLWVIYASVHLLNVPVLLAGIYRLFMIANPLSVDKVSFKGAGTQ